MALLHPKDIYIAQRNDSGSSWAEVYISGSNLMLQTDSHGHLLGSSILPEGISVLSASYSAYSVSSSFSESSSFAYFSNSASYARFVESASYALSASFAISSSRAYSAYISQQSISSSYAQVAGTARVSTTASYSISSSWSDTSGTSSYSLTASYLLGFNESSSYATTASYAISSSHSDFSNNSTSSSYSSTASYALNVPETSSYATTASYALTASFLTGFIDSSSYSLSSSYSSTASYVLGGISVNTSSLVVTASGAINNLTASYAMTSAFVNNTGNTGSGYLVGIPMDGFYGPGSTGSIANIQSGDRVEDAFDKVENILFKLAPARPPNLSTKTLAMVGAYTANLSGTNTTLSTVTNTTTPSFQLNGGMVVANAFSDGDTGQLSASLDGINVGARLLTTADDSGTYGSLQITSDADFYAGQQGKAGFWKALLAQIVVTSPVNTVGPHTAQLLHTSTGNTPNSTFYVDDPVAPSGISAQVLATGVTYISGAPGLIGGVSSSAITLSVTASNTVGRFYNSSRVFQGSGTGITSANFTNPSSPTSGSVQFGARSFSVNGGSVTENASFTLTAFNSFGTSTNFLLSGTHIRMDSTLDPANRVRSGFGQFPTSGVGTINYGGVFQPTESLAGLNEELQMLNGQIRYPTGDYTANIPVAGPFYTSVPPGSFNNLRWITYNMGAITTKTNVEIDFTNTVGFSGAIMSNFSLYIRVDGPTPTSGWIDGNAAFPGTGNPTNNGDPALSVANSSSTVKLVTFGTAVKTGIVYVRIGIPQGDSKRFGGITMIAT